VVRFYGGQKSVEEVERKEKSQLMEENQAGFVQKTAIGLSPGV